MQAVRFTPAARADVLDAYDWYETAESGLGRQFHDQVDIAIEFLSGNPQMFPVVYRDVRRVLLRNFPYGLFFRIEPEAVFVIACFHSSRNPRVWKQRT